MQRKASLDGRRWSDLEKETTAMAIIANLGVSYTSREAAVKLDSNTAKTDLEGLMKNTCRKTSAINQAAQEQGF